MVDGEDIIPQQSKSFSSGEMYSIAFIARFLFCCLFSLLSFLYLNSSFQFFFKIRVVVREGKRVLSKNASSSLRGGLLRPTMTTRSLVLGDEEVFSLTLSLSLCFSLSLSLITLLSLRKKKIVCVFLCVCLSLFSSLLFSPLSLFFIACCVARKTLTLPALDACIARLRCVARREKRHHRIETPGSRKNTRERGRLGKETHPRENDDEKKATRGIQRKEGRVPCFVWASQRGWSSFIERMDSGNIVRVFVCACVCVCDACACERVQKY